MGVTPPEPTRKYDLGFARWVYANVDGGGKLSLCMQCGVCSGSCPLGATEMDHGPRKLFMMVRAGMTGRMRRKGRSEGGGIVVTGGGT